MTRIWGFGSACLDFRAFTADYGEGYTSKLLAQSVRMLGGGACANCLVQAARLGGACGWLGRLGTDAIGREIKRQLEAEGVTLEHAVLADDMISPFNLAVYAGNDKRRVGGYLLPNSLKGLSERELRLLSACVQPGDIVYGEIGEIPVEECLCFLKVSRERGAVIVLDVDLDPIKQCSAEFRTIVDVFRLSDCILPNIEAMRSLACGEAEDIFGFLSGVCAARCVITAGEKGAYLLENGKIINVPALPIDAVDTVGAGDAFHGGVVYGLSVGMDIARAVRLGCVCGALNCLSFGAREGMPRREEALRYLNKAGDSYH